MEANNELRIPKKEKFSFGVYFVGQLILYGIVASYLSLFMTESGIDPFVISAVLLAAKVWDAVNDPLFAVVIDRKQLLKHKYSSWVRLSTYLIPLTTVFIFLMPGSLGSAAKVIWVLVGYVLWDTAYTMCDVPIHALATCMTDNVEERDGLFVRKTVFGYIGILIALFIPMLYPRIGWGATSIVMSVIAIATMLPISYLGKERYVSSPEKEPSLKQMLQYVAKNKPLLIFNLATIVACITATGSTAGNYVAIYLLGSEDYITYIALLTVIPTFLAVLLTKILLKKIDKFYIYIGSVASNVLFSVILFFVGYQNLVSYLGVLMIKALLGGCSSVVAAMFIADCAEYGHFLTGQRNQGIAFSTQTFTAKFTGAISTSVGMFILGLIGFRSGSGAVQSAATLKGLWYMYTLIPCISLTAAVVLLIFGYKLRSGDAQIMAKANAGEITREEAEASIRGAE